NSALPDTRLIISKIVKNLWEEKDLASFSMAVSIIVSLGKEASGYDKEPLEPISEAVKQILSDSDGEQVTEQLKLLHPKMTGQSDSAANRWLRLMAEILEGSDPKPSVIRFALEVLESGWLDPLLCYREPTMEVERHHQLLVRLESFDELKIEAAHCLKKWYKQFFSRENNSHLWQKSYDSFQKKEGNTFFVSDCHDGFSSSLEYKMASRSLQIGWTDEPEGIPNIERLLTHQPAFPRSITGEENHRPVIIMGRPCWDEKLLQKKAEDLFQRKVESSPKWIEISKSDHPYELEKNPPPGYWEKSDSERQRYVCDNILALDGLRHKCKQAIQQAFSHYLYRLTHSKGGCLTYCWADAAIKGVWGLDHYGAHDPSSPEELYAMMSAINSSSHFQESVKDDYLRVTLNASNALVLSSSELTTIAGEFLSSVNLNSIYDSLDT
ncbi:hypothetical protein, partial [Endozoicomonas sp. SESOKO3]